MSAKLELTSPSPIEDEILKFEEIKDSSKLPEEVQLGRIKSEWSDDEQLIDLIDKARMLNL